ncbi:MAG: acyl-CoA/acyl-ACP dehydrogenase [Planctomycetota bacterium]|nr:acyl-CoA/acyl-ACP dehydrogenase [Planctomycetota bacterium]
MNSSLTPNFDTLIPLLHERANRADIEGQGAWPAEDLADLTALGAWRWAIPTAYGGDETEALDLHFRYESIASGSLATALLLTQRDSAAALIAGADAPTLPAQLLPRMARGESFCTVGIAQLTTSRQGGVPALRAVANESGYRLNGFIPWSSGAAKSAIVVAGAATEDAQEILFVLPTELAGVQIGQPMPLVALRSSFTTQIDCKDVQLDRKWLLRGPIAKVLAGRSRGLPIGQAFLALGLSRGGLDLIARHDSDRARSLHHQLDTQLADLRERVIAFCQQAQTAETAAAGPGLRGECGALAVKITQASVAIYKGTALLAGHPAQRLSREAMFLLVWSCADPVIDCTLNALTGC